MTTHNPDGTYAYTCVTYGAEGRLTLFRPHTTQPFNCPEGCGARYVEWSPSPGVYTLMCVVQPVFEDNDEKESMP